MCEFNVLLEGKVVFKDAVHVKVDGDNVILMDVLGASKTFQNCRILEVDVGSERMVLSSTKK